MDVQQGLSVGARMAAKANLSLQRRRVIAEDEDGGAPKNCGSEAP
jgi:hypothetical protein